jgi:hypothetical protein
MLKVQGSQEVASLPSTPHAEGAATSLLLRFHADEIFSHPSARVTPIVQNETFEELPLDQPKQKAYVKTGRKRIGGEAEVITSGDGTERMKETVNKKCEIQEQTRKKKTTKKQEENSDYAQLKFLAAI